MKRLRSTTSLITVISLFLCAIWLRPVSAADVPTFSSLGQIRAEGMFVPSAMDLDEAGNLYVADARSRSIFIFNPYGKLSNVFQVDVSGAGLAVSADGGKLYAVRENTVAIIDLSSGEVAGEFSGGADGETEFQQAGAVDVDSFGNVYVVDGALMKVKIYNKDGAYISSFGAYGVLSGQFKGITELYVDANDQVIVAESNAALGRIQKFSLDAANRFAVSSVTAIQNNDVNKFGEPAMHVPLGIAYDSNGRGYYLDYMGSTVRVVDPQFNYLSVYKNVGKQVGELSDVNDVVYDAANSRLFVSCSAGRIEILGVDGGANPKAVNSIPGTPVPQSPVAGVVLTATPELVFENAVDADGDVLSYSVIVRQGDTVVFQADVASGAGDTTSVVVDVEGGLAENESFTWTVQANDGKDLSAVSNPASFAVNAVEEAPTAPVASVVFDGASLDGSGVFSWGVSTDPDPGDSEITYVIELATDADFSGAGLSSEALSGTSLGLGEFADYGNLVDGTVYYWHVKALDADGDESDPGALDYFVYDTTSLSVTANVPGAKVSLHGNHAYAGQTLKGFAPIELRDFTSGAMSVVVERAGFEPFVAQVAIAEGENVDLYAELVPAMVVEKLSTSRNGINGRAGLSVGDAAAPFLVDFDNDGDLDLLVGDASGKLTLIKNMEMVSRNRLAFGERETLVNANGKVPFVADWNNDGKKDLVVGQANGAVQLFVNVGSEVAPAFGAGDDLILPVGLDAAPAVVDFDGDGNKDLLVGDVSGQVNFYRNIGPDAAPAFDGSKQTVLDAGVAAVPFPVDWDADGDLDILVSANDAVTVYKKVDGKYTADVMFDGRRDKYVAAFPIDLDGSGKQLLAGKSNGEIVYLTGNSIVPVSSFHLALQDKATELVSLVQAEAETLVGDAQTIHTLVAAGDYAAAAAATATLISALPDGGALVSAQELLNLLN